LPIKNLTIVVVRLKIARQSKMRAGLDLNLDLDYRANFPIPRLINAFQNLCHQFLYSED
jgi:hypothetical protein